MMSEVIINPNSDPGDHLAIVATSNQVWVPATPGPMNNDDHLFPDHLDRLMNRSSDHRSQLINASR
jgi:hypothetical protein